MDVYQLAQIPLDIGEVAKLENFSGPRQQRLEFRVELVSRGSVEDMDEEERGCYLQVSLVLKKQEHLHEAKEMQLQARVELPL
jgi:hypothetical protein